MSHDRDDESSAKARAWQAHNLSQLLYFRALPLRAKFEALEGMADIARLLERMRVGEGAGGGPRATVDGLPMLIRRAEIADAAALAQLAEATFTETFGHLYAPPDLAAYLGRVCTEQACREFIASPKSAAWFARPEGGAPVGFVTVADCKLPVADLEPKAGEIRQLYVLPGYQSARLGSRLMEIALAWLEAQGRRPLYVGVWSENHSAQRFYERYGFVKVGEYGFQVGRTVDREFILRADTEQRFRGSA